MGQIIYATKIITPNTVAVPNNKLAFIKELSNSFNLKEIETLSDNEIPVAQKQLVLDRIKKSKPENWLRRDDVMEDFKLY